MIAKIHFYKCMFIKHCFSHLVQIFNLKMKFEFLYAFLKTILYENYF